MLDVLNGALPPWVVALGIAVLATAILWLVRRLVIRHLERLARTTSNDLDDLAVSVLKRTKFWFLVTLGIMAGSRALDLAPRHTRPLELALLALVLLQAGLWLTGLLDGLLARGLRDREAAPTLGVLRFVTRLVLWSGLVLVGLDTAGINITALVAGLGVGGVAVALAVQNILSDLFASLSIALDQPFVVGDFIIVDDLMGTVEYVGLKTTRVRSLSGEQLVFSNTNLLNTRIRNFGRMYERRVVFGFGVIYQTPPATLKAIAGMVKEIITAESQTRFDRAHFKGFGASSLDFEVVYFVLSPDYNLYMDIQERINLALAERFLAEGIEFAYPTQTIYLAGQEGGAK